MGRMYIARCKAGKVVAASIANTPLEQADAAKDVKRWSKTHDVALEDIPKGQEIDWCFSCSKAACKKCTKVITP